MQTNVNDCERQIEQAPLRFFAHRLWKAVCVNNLQLLFCLTWFRFTARVCGKQWRVIHVVARCCPNVLPQHVVIVQLYSPSLPTYMCSSDCHGRGSSQEQPARSSQPGAASQVQPGPSMGYCLQVTRWDSRIAMERPTRLPVFL